MLDVLRWIALSAAVVLVLAGAGTFLTSHAPQEFADQEDFPTAGPAESIPTVIEKEKSLWNTWFPDSTAVFTLFLVLFTAVLAYVSLKQLDFLGRAEIISARASNAAREAANTAHEALVKSQRAFVRISGFPWLWRPDLSRPGKYVYDIAPAVENGGDTPTVDMTINVNSALRDSPLPENFDFPYQSKDPGKTLVGGRQSITASNSVISDEDLLAVQNGKKFFYLWGTITYRDVFDGTPVHVTEYASEVGRVMGNPLDPRDPESAKGTTVEIYFRIYKSHNKQT
jgi:hypothetical protein